MGIPHDVCAGMRRSPVKSMPSRHEYESPASHLADMPEEIAQTTRGLYNPETGEIFCRRQRKLANLDPGKTGKKNVQASGKSKLRLYFMRRPGNEN